MTTRSLSTLFLILALVGVSQASAGGKGDPPPISYDHVITLTPSGDPCTDGDSLEDTVDNIDDAGPSNTYLVSLEPGNYALCGDTLFMKPYVDVAGINRPTTIIRGYGAPAPFGVDPTVVGANKASIYTLTILTRPETPQVPPTTNSISMGNAGTSPTVRDVTIISDGGLNDRGIRNIAASPVLEDVDIVVRGKTRGYGIVNQSASASLKGVSVTVFGASDSNVGIVAGFYESSGLTMKQTIVFAAGGAEDIGIKDTGSSLFEPWLVAQSCQIHGDHYGILATEAHSGARRADIRLFASRVEGKVSTIDAIFSSVLVANSTLKGGPVVAYSASCRNVVDDAGNPYGPACESPASRFLMEP